MAKISNAEMGDFSRKIPAHDLIGHPSARRIRKFSNNGKGRPVARFFSSHAVPAISKCAHAGHSTNCDKKTSRRDCPRPPTADIGHVGVIAFELLLVFFAQRQTPTGIAQ